jgi:signal transduction histidine kinase
VKHLSAKPSSILALRSLETLSPDADSQPWRERIELVRQTARAQAMYRSAVQVFAATTPESLYEAVLSAVCSLVRVDLAALFLVRPDDGRPACRALRAGRSTALFDAAEAPTTAFADAALEAAAPLMVEAPHPLLDDLPSCFNGARTVGTLLAAPIRSESQGLGVLVVGRRTSFPFSPDQTDLLQGLADQTSLALGKLRVMEAAAEQGRRAQEFVSVASHEMRTPLTALQGFSELLLSREVSEDVQKSWISLINQESVRLGSLIGELLDLTRLESGRVKLNLEPVNLRQAAEHVVSLWGNERRRSRFSIRIQAGVPSPIADLYKLTQVLANLVSNAVNYSPPGAPIRIEVAPGCLARPSTLHLGQPQQGGASCPAGVSIAVRDGGAGISPEDQAKVFQPFYRAAQPDGEGGDSHAGKAGGAGLGLTIARRLVEWHGGLMWVESCQGKGSTFGFCLPLCPPSCSTSRTALTSGAIA